MSRQLRRSFIQGFTEVEGLSILEVGALDSPTFPELECRFLDWFTGDELRSMIGENPNRSPERVVDPDYVIKAKRFADTVDRRFDLVVANHVLEHIADPLTWLEQVAAITEPGGHLFLALPDRRYTFDYLRPLSTVADLLRAQEEDLERPSKWQVLEAMFYYRPIRAKDVWEHAIDGKLERGRYVLDEALARAASADRDYVDTHCYVFSADSFPALVSDLGRGGFTEWRVEASTDVPPGENEFHVWLGRT
jgi:SAM-dependent methyltransferase